MSLPQRTPVALTRTPHGPLTPEDLEYILASYITLGTACRGRCTLADARKHIEGRRWPAGSYVLDDGTEMVPLDYFALLDEAGSEAKMASSFFERYARVMNAAGLAAHEATILAEWEAFLDGVYGVCLRSVTPETIFRKESLVVSAAALIAQPAPADATWRRDLRAQVEELNSLLRPFAPCDRARFGGSVSRDRIVKAAKERFPVVFPT